jgi:hypothetical protein
VESQVRAPAPHERASERDVTEPEAPTSEEPPPVPPASAPQIAADTFAVVWKGKAERAERECWAEAESGSPEALGFILSVDASGHVTKAEPQYGGERAEAAYKQLYECVGTIIKTMKFDGVTRAATTMVQANRPGAR